MQNKMLIDGMGNLSVFVSEERRYEYRVRFPANLCFFLTITLYHLRSLTLDTTKLL